MYMYLYKCINVYIYIYVIYDIEHHHTGSGLTFTKLVIQFLLGMTIQVIQVPQPWYSNKQSGIDQSKERTWTSIQWSYVDGWKRDAWNVTHDPGLLVPDELLGLISSLHEIPMTSNGYMCETMSGTVPHNIHLIIFTTHNPIKCLERCNVCHWRANPPFFCCDPNVCWSNLKLYCWTNCLLVALDPWQKNHIKKMGISIPKAQR